MPKLGVNIDHIATLRQQRREGEPDLIQASQICEKAGAHSIVCHLREDRRHIQDSDVTKLAQILKKPLTFELSLNKDIIAFAKKIRPEQAMFVPERRQELTTEGGLNVIKYERRIQSAMKVLKTNNIKISLFIDPKKTHIKHAQQMGSDIVELHTGPYSQATTKEKKRKELLKLKDMADYAKSLNLIVHAGHGLKYHDVGPIARIKHIDELNIGHAIISRSIFVGLDKAVKEMLKLIR